MTATHTHIVHHFLDLVSDPETSECNLSGNWGTSYDNSKWQVDPDTYINGVIATLDFDYHMGWIIEVCDRRDDVTYELDGYEHRSCLVQWFAIVAFHGRDPETLEWEHDSAWLNAEQQSLPPQEFFVRTLTKRQVTQWGVGRIHDMLECWDERQ